MTEEKKLPPSSDELGETGIAIETVQSTLKSFIDSADVTRVYGEPIEKDDTTIIPAAEVLVGLGFGAGFGAGRGDSEEEEETSYGGGGGGGGGGRTLSRPVAVIIASPDGVRVEPVVDPTKIALAAVTAAGFMLATLRRMKSPRRALRKIDQT